MPEQRRSSRIRTAAAGALALLLAGLLWWLMRGAQNPEAGTASAGAQRSPAAGAPAEASLPEAPPPEDPVRREEAPVSEAPPPQADSAEATLVRFRGRCVAAETGEPLAGCTVRFHGWQGNSSLIARYGEPDWKEPEPFVTGADGLFRFDVPETLPYQFALDCDAPGRLGRSDRYDTELPGGTAFDLGDVPLQRGAEVAGIVRDELGAPVEGIGVQVSGLPMEIRPGQGAGDTIGARSAADGGFRFGAALPAGTWPLSIFADACTLVEPQSVTIEPGLGPAFLEVRVRRSPWLEGVVVDESGLPVPRAYVDTVRQGGGRIEADWTDREGRFRIHRQREGDDPVRLTVEDGGLEPTKSVEAFAWGTTGIRLQARRLLTVEILVREKGSGAPVEDFSLRCHGTKANSSSQTALRLGGVHPGGRLKVNEVAFGDNLLVVVPKDPALLPNPPLTFSAPWEAEAEALVVELERLEPLRLRIESPAGKPIAGSTVALLDQDLPEVIRPRHFDPRGGTSRFGGLPEREEPVLWSIGESGADGEVRLFLPAGVPLAFAVVEGAHPRWSRELERPLELAPPIVLTVPLGALVHGRLIHPHAGGGKVGVLAVPVESNSQGEDPWLPAKDGSFASPGLVAGDYALKLSVFNEVSSGGASFLRWLELEPPLALITLGADETRELVLDASHFAFGAIHARATLPEPASTGLTLYLLLLPPPGAERPFARHLAQFGAYAADAAGGFRAEQLPPGAYEAEARWKSADGSHRRLRSRNRLELPAGGTVSGSFEFARLKLRLRVLDPEGKPVAGAGIRTGAWFLTDGPLQTTDAGGWVEFDWMDPGRAEFRVTADPPLRLPSVEVLADREVTVAEVRATPGTPQPDLSELLRELEDG